jgi:hypothetical protein
MQLVNIVLTRALSGSLALFPPVGGTEILERAEGVQRQSESLTDRHSLARFRGCCRVAVGEGEGSPCRRLATDARRRKLAPPFLHRPSGNATAPISEGAKHGSQHDPPNLGAGRQPGDFSE